MSERPHPHENRLAGETSPYLLQHAHNPVDWYPWGEEALARARSEDRPILLSIGYAACHWCHVMERESFENEDTARLMNESFVCIKVDREERPDLDDIYMAATIAMSGSGGWPMTVFLAPDQRPFFAGTYFPPHDAHGRPGFPSLLRRIAELWRRDRQRVLAQAADLTQHLHGQAAAESPLAVGDAPIAAVLKQLEQTFDPKHGGFGHAPKFPPTAALELCLRHHRRTGQASALAMVERTLDGMARGGMRDHLGGGFARYSTDERWLVPHFEKMLYDNALLARAYVHGFQATGHARYRRVVLETLDYVLREMTATEGGFFSATDADSEGEEGKFFVWTPAEIEAVLPPELATPFCAYYDVSAGGNWEGKSILHTPRALDDVARELGLDASELEQRLADGRARLLRARRERVLPLCDDKVLVAWNALMIGALAECGRVFAVPRWVASAARAAEFVAGAMTRPDGGLYRTYRAGRAHLDAYLEDYAYLADALVDLYEASGEPRFLERALGLARRAIADFRDDETGSFFATAHGHEQLLVRLREGQDAALPSPSAVMARAAARLSWHVGDDALREVARAAVRAHGRSIDRVPRAFTTTLAVVDLLLEGPTEVVAVGLEGDEGLAALLAELGRHYLPNAMIVHRRPGETKDAPDRLAPAELVAGKELVTGHAAVYVCRAFACRAPVTDPGELAHVLEEAARAAAAERMVSVAPRPLPGRATADGTVRFEARHGTEVSPNAYRALGSTGLRASAFAFGGYRIDDEEPSHAHALERAVEGGVNLVDTSTNYTDGGSERAVGGVLRRLVASGAVARDEIVVVSKIGYVQGRNLTLARERQRAGDPFPEMVTYADGCWHCIHPSHLADQLPRSLERLGLETLDVCLLHNPEYFFAEAEENGREVDEALREAFYERVERAFRHLESEVARGRVGCYGVSSNTVAKGAADPQSTDLERLLAAAERAGAPEHHFRVLQLPLNLHESGGALSDEGASLLERAAAAGLAVLANRPLNAVSPEGMLRLADPPRPRADVPSFDAALAAVRAAEAHFASQLAPDVRLRERGQSTDELFRFGAELATSISAAVSVEQVDDLSARFVAPQLARALVAVDRAIHPGAREDFEAWRLDYTPKLEALLAALHERAAERAAERIAKLRVKLDPLLPSERRTEGMARIALWALASTPGLSVVLLGMRAVSYVDDALAVMTWPAHGHPEELLRALRRA